MSEGRAELRVAVHDARIVTLDSASDDGTQPGWWTPPGGTVVLRAERAGVTPFSWRRIGDTLHLSAQPATLADLPPAASINVATLSLLPHRTFPKDDASCFIGVHRVLAGTQVEIDSSPDESPVTTRWWEPAAEPFSNTDNGSASERLWAALVEECARAMTRGRAAIMLSGGLDSAALAAAAMVAARRHALPQPLLLAATYPGLACDETEYQQMVAAHLELPLHSVNATEIPLWPAAAQAYARGETPIVDGQEGINRSLYVIAREEGCSVILYGVGADELFQGVGLETDFLRAGRLGDAWTFLRSLRELRMLSWPDVILRRGLRTATRSSPHGISAEQRRRAGSWARAMLRRSLAASTAGWRYELADRTAIAESVSLGMPFLGPAVLDAVADAPSASLLEGGRLKGLLREAVRPYLPRQVVDRVRKANFQAYFRHRFSVERGELLARYNELRPSCPPGLTPPDDPFLAPRGGYDERSFLTAWFWLGIFAFNHFRTNSPRGSDLNATRAS
ncbi:MAG: asparagine synthase C-terminal domain-containing protein [Gemmatimonadota bacterium]